MYVPARSQALAAEPQGEEKWRPYAKSAIVERLLRRKPTADLFDPLQIECALRRRGLAAELAGVVTLKSHEKLRQTLITAMTDPPDDNLVWMLLAISTPKGIRAADSGGVLPLDTAVSSSRKRFL